MESVNRSILLCIRFSADLTMYWFPVHGILGISDMEKNTAISTRGETIHRIFDEPQYFRLVRFGRECSGS